MPTAPIVTDRNAEDRRERALSLSIEFHYMVFQNDKGQFVSKPSDSSVIASAKAYEGYLLNG